jgi:hypothetical protein
MKFDNFSAVDSGFANISGNIALAPTNLTSTTSAFPTTMPVSQLTMNGAQLMSLLPPLDLTSQSVWNQYASLFPDSYNNFRNGFPYVIHYWNSGTPDLYGKRWYAIILGKNPLGIPNLPDCQKLFQDTRYRFTSTGQPINAMYRIFLLFRDFYQSNRCAQEFIIKSNYWRYFTGSPTIIEPLVEQQINPEYTSEAQLDNFKNTWMSNFNVKYPNFRLGIIRI